MSGVRMRVWGACFLLAPALSSVLGAAGAPTLVADLSQSLAARSSSPGEIHRLGEYVVFGASDPYFGYELHSFRPATSRTELLVDATPGTAGSQVIHAGEVASRLLYWSGPIGRSRLFVTDGTSAGTREVVDRDGAQIVLDYPRPTVVIGTRAVLQGNEAATGRAGLWAVDGDGKAERVWRGGDPESIWLPAIASYAASRDRVTFLELPADDSGTAVWVTDGTSLGTRLVDTVDCFAESGVATADHFLFVCRSYEFNGDHWEIYSSDGTAGGTVRLGDWEAGAEEGSPRLLGANSGRAYFETWSASWRASFWMTDGTVAGTRRLTRAADWRSSGSDYPSVWFGDEFYFWAMDGEWPDTSYDYWSHDGSSASPQRMRTGGLGEHSWTHSPIPVGDRLLLFSLDGAGAGEEIWAKRLGSSEVEQVSHFCPPVCREFIATSGVDLGDSALVTLEISSSMFGSSWMVARSDGTVEGTRALALSWEGEARYSGGYPGGSAAVDGGYFVAGWNSTSGSEPWFVDEVSGSLRQLANLEPENAPAFPSGLLSTGGDLYFQASGVDDTNGPWRVANSGTPRHLSPSGCDGSFSFRPSGMVGGRVLFEGDSGCLLAFEPLSETWETLVEESGQARVTGTVVASNGLAYFLRAGTRLWHTDGTPAGTVPMGTAAFDEPRTIVGVTSTHIYLWSDYYLSTLHSVGLGDGFAENLGDLSGWNLWQPTRESRVIGSRFFFTARTTSDLETLSSSTGHATETGLLWTSAIDERVLDLYELGGELYFVVAGARAALWRSDGTAAGTRPVADLGPLRADADDGRAHSAAALDGRLYFVSENAATGAELWSSDGTAAGTRLHDLAPGVAGSDPREITAVAGRLFFSAAGPGFGREIWTFDPATGRASRVGDIAAGALSSVPEELTAVGSTVYFAADDGIHGRELWKVDAAAPPAPCVPSSSRLCLLDGRFEVEALWRDFRDRTGRASGTALASGSATFSFKEGGGAELMVKLVEVCLPPGREETWIYAAGLTNLDVTLALRDTRTGDWIEWRNELGETFEPRVASVSGRSCDAAATVGSSATGADATLSLYGGRFIAGVDWSTSTGASGFAVAVPLDDRSGYFWFFNAAYPEVLVRMVDACGFAGFDNFWVLAAGLTDVGVQLSLIDTWTGEVIRHESAQGHLFAPLLETGELQVCAAPAPLLP